MLEIRFARVSNNQQFSVTRKVKAIIGDAADYALLLPTAPYVQRRRANREAISDWIPGVPPTRSSAIAWRSKLRQYTIPEKDLRILSLPPVNTNAGGDIVPPEIRSYLPRTLNLSTHADTFSKLLWLEEISMGYINYLIQSRFLLSYFASLEMHYEYTTWSPSCCQSVGHITSEAWSNSRLLKQPTICYRLSVPGLAEKRPSVITGEYYLN
jgi:hypothetical protein